MLISDKYDFIFGKGFTYIRPLLVNNRKQWKYIGVLHEYIISSNILSSSLMEEIILLTQVKQVVEVMILINILKMPLF